MWVFFAATDDGETMLLYDYGDGDVRPFVAFTAEQHDSLFAAAERVSRLNRMPILVRHFEAVGSPVGIIGV
jgi:hypothetical protein